MPSRVLRAPRRRQQHRGGVHRHRDPRRARPPGSCRPRHEVLGIGVAALQPPAQHAAVQVQPQAYELLPDRARQAAGRHHARAIRRHRPGATASRQPPTCPRGEDGFGGSQVHFRGLLRPAPRRVQVLLPGQRPRADPPRRALAVEGEADAWTWRCGLP